MQMQRQDDLMEELESELMEEKDIEDKLFDNDYQEEASIYPDVTIKVERAIFTV